MCWTKTIGFSFCRYAPNLISQSVTNDQSSVPLYFRSYPENSRKKRKSPFRNGVGKTQDLLCYAKELRPDVFANYFRFAIVRNPWDRMPSDYIFQKRKNSPANEKLFAVDECGQTRRFREWVEVALSDPFHFESRRWGAEVSPGIHRWSPQVDWISLNGNIAVDRVLRMECLQNDFEDVRRVMGGPFGELPCRNWKFHLHYSHYYDEATQRLVGDYYAK